MHIESQKIYEALSSNSYVSWAANAALSIVIAIVVKLVIKFISKIIRRYATKTASHWDDWLVDLLDTLKLFVLFAWIFFFNTRHLTFAPFEQKLMMFVIVFATSFQFGMWGLHLLKNWRNSILLKKIEKDPSSSATIGLLYLALQTILIVTIVLIGLSNLGINIGALLAGLGVGGIAVALAAQNILGDLLASLSIVLDKPFVVGDFIVNGEEKGTIEHIGVKTTRLRSLNGEELIISNKDLLEARVRNYKRMKERRAVHRLGVEYSTSYQNLSEIPIWIKAILVKYKKVRFDRCHFVEYGPSSLIFELVFFVEDPDYDIFMDLQQRILLDIFQKFEYEKILFAKPTQSLYIEKIPK
ncbi:MAG: mechanosensitive ion channel [Bacteriovoracaceae bacterium]